MINKSILTMDGLTDADIRSVLETASVMKSQRSIDLLQGSVMASCFFEPSTRTRLSFETAMYRLGGQVIGFSNSQDLSVVKGESFRDTIKTVGCYADVLVIRHPSEGAVARAAEETDKPVINAGDGSHEHPTQTLTDLFSIQECQGRLEDLNIVLVGDLLHARTIHSLVSALCRFSCRLFLVSHPSLGLPVSLINKIHDAGIVYSCHEKLEDTADYADVIYVTRLQKERIHPETNLTFSTSVVSYDLIKKFKPGVKVLHPLPRLEELSEDLDNTPHAYYFQQIENGVYIRQALLALIFGKISLGVS